MNEDPVVEPPPVENPPHLIWIRSTDGQKIDVTPENFSDMLADYGGTISISFG